MTASEYTIKYDEVLSQIVSSIWSYYV